MARNEGFKYWSDQEFVQGFDANAYLMSQSVMRFDNPTDRSVSLARSLVEGMLSYDKSTTSLQLYDGTTWQTIGVVGVLDHGLLTNLGDDDHTQYFNETRGDARYYTQTQIDALLSGLSTDHGDLTGLNDNDHPQYAVAGSNGEIQYNNGGAFGGSSGLVYNDATETVNIADGYLGVGRNNDGTYRVDIANNAADGNILRLKGADDTLNFTVSAGDFSILNSQQSNGIVIYDGNNGVEIWYNGAAVFEADNDGVKVNGTAISVDGHTHSYASTTHTHSYAATDHNHQYNVNNGWLRENGDNAHVKLYGNSRQMAFRTDGTTEYASGVSTFAFLWMYGGDAASNRRMGLNSSGQLWTSNYGYLHDKFAALSHSHSYLSTSGGTISGNLTVTGVIDVNEVLGDNGSQTDPSFTFTTDADTGMYRNTTNSIAFTTGGARRTVIHSDGHIYQYYQLLVPNMDATGSYNTIRWNSSNGHIMRYSSTIDIKKDIVAIKPVMEYLNERSLIHDLRPVLFHEKDQQDGTNNTRGEYLSGMIAQEVLEVAPELCYYDQNGQLTSYGLEALIPHLIAEIQRLTPLVEEMYGTAHPDWVAPTPRPAERAAEERQRYEEAAAAQALVGQVEL